MAYYVYVLASRRNGTLYVGVTNDLVRRVYGHRCRSVPGFTHRYAVDQLVWFEAHDEVTAAIQREKSLKRWLRRWKVDLIERTNPTWRACTTKSPDDATALGPRVKPEETTIRALYSARPHR